ncbi:MltA-interacting protein MipA [Marinibacterium anthonyi]|nr:MltA-interacting protein MipA [Marinibacterium anthonyi]
MRHPICAAALAVMAGPALAQDAGPEWQGLAAMGLRLQPEFEGSRDYETQVVPFISLDYGRVSLGRDGLALTAFRASGATMSFTLSYDGDRDGSDLDVPGFDDIDKAIRLGLVGSYVTPVGRLYASLQHYTSETNGTSATLGLSRRLPVTNRLSLTADLSASFSDDKYMQGYFGVDAAQSAASGLAQYDADAGFRRVQLGLGATYKLSENLRLGGLVSLSQLGGDARNSPIVQEERGVTSMIYMGYQF